MNGTTLWPSRAAATLAAVLVVSQTTGCGQVTAGSDAGDPPSPHCLQLHPVEGSPDLPETWPDLVSTTWPTWVRELGDGTSVERVPTSSSDVELAARSLPSIETSTPSAVCRVVFNSDGHFLPTPPVSRGDEAVVVLWETDIRTLGYGTTPKHGYAVAVLDPVTGESLAYVERG